MIPVDFPEANKTFTAPRKEDEAWCGDLRVHIGEEDGLPVLISCWQPSWKDRLRILLGGPVWQTIVGRGLPPSSLRTECPFKRVRNDGRPS